jgi:hypothetical protein
MQGTWGRRQQVAIGALAALCFCAITASSASAVAPTISEAKVSGVTSTSATLEAKITPDKNLSTAYHFEYGKANCSKSACTKTPIPDLTLAAGSSPATVKVTVEGLVPASVYHFRVVAKNTSGTTTTPDHVFATNGAPVAGLPDARAYEQASPLDKDGGDAVGDVPLVKATAGGGGISFGSTFGIPGGKGAQELPTYLAQRGPGQSGWMTQGLLPPASSGQQAQVLGRSPDDTEVFSAATKLGTVEETAFLVQSTAGGPPTVIAPYSATVTEHPYAYVGQTPDASVVFFESTVKLVPEALEGLSNLYAWDRASAKVSLAGVLNDKASPPKGAFAGPYDWSNGISAKALREGGAQRNYYLQGTHAVSEGGDVFFTEAGTGQLYLRLNPTREQSPLNGEGKCKDLSLACTIHVSASQKTNGKSENLADPVGPQPAAFQAASADGSEVLFTSPEKLTNDANTGPEQSEAAIGRGGIGGSIEDPKLLKEPAIGVAVDSEYIYWANPILGTIGRAKLDGTGIPDNEFLTPGPVKFETEPGSEEFESVESSPRYVAVDAGHIYWTNSGRRDTNGEPLDGGGTIGRADIEGTKASIEPDFIRGASNPQGIAVNASHIYWANAAKDVNGRSIGRAEIDGGKVEQEFFVVTTSRIPYGVALSADHVYFAMDEEVNNNGYLARITLDGKEEEFHFIGKSALRGVAVDSEHVYWASQDEEAIGRIPVADFSVSGSCETIPNCKSKFIPLDGAPTGLAADGSHLYWSLNGETSSNPGNDLYRYLPATGALEDLTALGAVGTGNGAEVQGLVGAAADGSYLYFAANGDLDGAGPATSGDCHTSPAHGSLSTTTGHCSLYAWHEGKASLVARLGPDRGERSDALNWTGTPRDVFGGGANLPKTSFTSDDGQALLFRSREKLTPYDNEGVPELYRYRAGDSQVRCASCRPSGEAAAGGPSLGSIKFPAIGPRGSVSSTASRNLSADGERAFFETAEALSPLDTNGQGGCLPSGQQGFPACLDVYEWEAPGAPGGSCQEPSPSYSPLNGGCVYLISTGKSEFPSLFADASQDSGDVFFFTREQLVGQDKDGLQDVYDARVGGGLAAQSQVAPVPCESAEACHEAPPAQPAQPAPATPTFVGPANAVPKHKKQKHKKKHHHHKKHKKQGKAKAKGRARR